MARTETWINHLGDDIHVSTLSVRVEDDHTVHMSYDLVVLLLQDKGFKKVMSDGEG